MEEIHRNRLRENLLFLLQNLKVDRLLDLIYSSTEKVLSDEDYEKILAQTTESDKIRQTVLILRRSGPKAFDVFIHSLKSSDQTFIAEELLKEKGNEQASDSEDTENQLPGKELYGADEQPRDSNKDTENQLPKPNGTGSSWRQHKNKADCTVQPSTLTGYIHQVQKKCRSKKGNWYSSFLVQTGETTYQRCITFFPDLHKDPLERYAEDQISVCLKGCSYFMPIRKRKYKKNALMIDSSTEFENAEVRFTYNPQPYTPLADIDDYCLGEFISIKVEIIKAEEPTKIINRGEKLDMQVKLVRDKDGVEMKLIAWKEFVSDLRVGKWYELSCVSVKKFDGTCRISTNTTTSAMEANFE